MQDFILTMVVVFVLFRILGSFRSTTVFNNTYNQHTHNPSQHHTSKKEGEVKVTYIKEDDKKKKGNTGEYVDYEEIK